MTTNERIAALRQQMAEQGLDAYVVVNADPHLSENPPDHYLERAWLSGFNGSAGTVVVTHDKSGLWTDGRYYLQAERQLAGSEMVLYRMSDVGTVSIPDFLVQELGEGAVVGFNGRLMETAQLLRFQERFEAKHMEMRADLDLIGTLWTEGRPPLPMTPALLHGEEYAGCSAAQKLAAVHREMERQRLDYYLVGALDCVDWLCNLRGEDVECAPLLMGFVLVTPEETTLFVHRAKLTPETKAYLSGNGFAVAEYDTIYERVADLVRHSRVGLDPMRVNAALYTALPQNTEKVLQQDIILGLKAVKNETEQKWERACHLADGVAMVRFLMWLEGAIGKEPLVEYDISAKLLELRGRQADNHGASFPTICGYQANGAVIHYEPEAEGSGALSPEGLMVVDSGGQYLGGTTDITRTLALGPITEEQRRDFTLVLKSFIGLHSVRFLEGTPGKSLDILARKPMWDNDLNYKHGTGHGVGFFLNCHEGPNNFADGSTPLRDGMVISIEPGIYKAGKHGIRTENLVLVVKDRFVEEVGQFYRFEALTQCPIDRTALDVSLLTEEELQWLNDYHAGVYEKLAPRLCEEERTWLKRATAPLTR